jgi:allophanate hydrolase subunit 1
MLDIYESGDAALRVVAQAGDAEANWATVHSQAGWLATAGVEGIHGAVPTYDSVLVEFDP